MEDYQVQAKNAAADAHNPLGVSPNAAYTVAQAGTPATTQPTLGAAGYTVPNEDATVTAGRAFQAAEANKTYDPDKIKSDTIASFQNQIDALKQVYAQKLGEAKVQGLNRLGQASVGQSRAGLIGSGSAGQQNDTIASGNTSIENGITDLENAAISAVMDKANTAAIDAADKALAAKNAGINSYTASINSKAATTKELISKTAQNILSGGISDGSLTPAFFDSVAQNFTNSGYTVTGADLMSAYKTAKADKATSDAKALKDSQTTLSEGQVIVGPDGKVVAKGADKPITIGEGESYIDPSGKVIYKNPKTFAPTTGNGLGNGTDGLSATAKAVIDGTIQISDLTPTMRAKVGAEISANGNPSSRQAALQTNLALADSLLNNPHLDQLSGAPNLGTIIPGTPQQLAKKQYEQLLGTLKLENRTQLKGQGAISDFEFKVLGDAASALSRSLSDKDFKTQIQKVRDVFAGKYALTQPGEKQTGALNNNNIGPSTYPNQINYQGKLYSVDAAGNLTPA